MCHLGDDRIATLLMQHYYSCYYLMIIDDGDGVDGGGCLLYERVCQMTMTATKVQIVQSYADPMCRNKKKMIVIVEECRMRRRRHN